MSKKLSVVIPVYNAEKYIAEAVGSVLEQGWDGEVEVIVIDDGSTDRSCEIAESLGCKVLHQDRLRAANARNRGIKEASGDLIFMLDADDVSAAGSLAKLLEPFISDDSVIASFGMTVDFYSPDMPEEERVKIKIRTEPYAGILPGASLIARSVFDEVGLFDSSMTSGETVDWMVRLRSSGMKTVQIEDTVLRRRIHMTNTGRTDRREEMKNYAALLRKRMGNK